jgi:DNA-binding transcriptional ArsR family regulator
MNDSCEVFCTDIENVSKVQNEILEYNFSGVVEIFKALSDPTRFKIAYSLYKAGELCVCDVSVIIGSSVATASHHLRLLKTLGITKSRKEGKLIYYSLDDDHVNQLIKVAFEHYQEKSAK